MPKEVDLILVSIPSQAVPAGIADAAAISAKAAVVFTAGFQEIGEEGRKLQQDDGRQCRGQDPHDRPELPRHPQFPSADERLAGGASRARGGTDRVHVAERRVRQRGGRVRCATLRIGISKLASIGNMADLTHARHIPLSRRRSRNDASSPTFVEGVPDVSFFLDTIAEVSRKKPILILKGGRSKTGQRAALSHTGSLAGDGRVWESLVREAGGIFVDNSEELFDGAMALARAGNNLPRGRRTSIFSLAGGPGVVGADHCEAAGMTLPPLEDALQSLRPIVPPFAALGNPVEVTGQTKREHMHTCAQAVITQPNIDAMIGIALGLDFAEFAQSIIEAKKTKPVVDLRGRAEERDHVRGGRPCRTILRSTAPFGRCGTWWSGRKRWRERRCRKAATVPARALAPGRAFRGGVEGLSRRLWLAGDPGAGRRPARMPRSRPPIASAIRSR